MRIGIVGNGVVGAATAHSYKDFAEVRVYDLRPEKSPNTLEEVLDSDLVFLCLPTPQSKDSLACDVSVVDDFCNMLGGTKPDGYYVLKSTVPIGTTKRLSKEYGLTNLVHSPEFLSARTANEDACNPARNIIGHPNCTSGTTDKIMIEGSGDCLSTLRDLYLNRFPDVPLLLMSSDESEATKLFCNSFYAVKVSYWNEVRTLADKLGLNWESVMEGVLSSGWINRMHTQVPGPDGKFGWGGDCYPKDLASTIFQLQQEGLMASVCAGAHNRNLVDRERNNG